MNNKPFFQLDADGGNWYQGRTFSVFENMELLKVGGRPKVDFPTRAEKVCFILLQRGKSEQIVNMHGYSSVEGTLIFLGAGALYRVESIDPETRLTGIAVDASSIGDLLQYKVPVMLSRFALDCRKVMEPENKNLFISMVENLITLARIQGDESHSVNYMLASLLSFCCKEFDDIEPRMAVSSREVEIVNRFLHLLNLSRGRKRKISDYSGELCVSDHHLSVTVKKLTGYTVKDLIDKMVLAEIKMMLTRTEKSVAQISEEMEFPNCSFMCNFFKKQEGLSPLKFRDEHSN